MNGGEVIFKFKGDDKDLEKKTNGVTGKLKASTVALGNLMSSAIEKVGSSLLGLGKDALQGVADLEQNIGGVETLFKDSADTVIENSKKAYTTAGIDANKYMEQITSFSASLLQSLGGDTAEAAKVGDMAIQDMADNSNKFGTAIENIQNAYQGFAKQNYTMLDNLKLGYGGTKTEMERLLADAEKISGVKYDISNLNDVFNAIHVIQEELDVTGTTAKEASTTISGSINSAKSAFSNFLSGAGGIEEVISTFTTAGTNISNAIVKMAPQIITGITTLLNNLVPLIGPLLQAILPALIQGTSTLIMGLVQALPGIIQILMGMLPTIIQELANMLPVILTSLIQGLVMIIQELANQLPTLIPVIIDAILSTIPMLIDNLPLFIEAGFKLLGGLIAGILNALPILLARAGEIVVDLVEYFKGMPKMMWDCGKNLIQGLWNGIKSAKDWVLDKIAGIGNSIMKKIKGIFGIHSPSTEFAWVGKMNMLGLEKGMEDMKGQVNSTVGGMFDDMFSLSPSLYGSSSTNLSPQINVVVNNNMEQDPLGQMVNNIKTFSGGSKNDYNYGMGGA
jgi:phage-related protein